MKTIHTAENGKSVTRRTINTIHLLVYYWVPGDGWYAEEAIEVKPGKGEQAAEKKALADLAQLRKENPGSMYKLERVTNVQTITETILSVD